MAQSKFLKFQDSNGDYLIDVCEVELSPPEEPVCKDCVMNPKAIVPDWKTFENLTPFLNEKICLYYIALTTPETTTGSDQNSTEQEAEDALNSLYEQYSEEVIEAFLDYYNKALSESNKQVMNDNIEYREYYLEARPSSHLQLLYSFPFEILSLLDDEEGTDEEEPIEAGDITVEYLASEMPILMTRVRKGLNLYSRYEKVYKFTDGGSLLFVDTGGLFNLSNYGDAGLIAGSSITSNLIPQLDRFLNEKGFNIPGVGGISGIFEDRVTRIEFVFTEKYVLKEMSVYTELCGERATKFNRTKLARLNTQSAWKDPTAVAYFAQMKDMERDLTARTPKPWVEFIKEYTYPQIDTVINAGYTNTDPENGASSCIAENLISEGKQIGQDILSDVFGLGDAIAAQFHKALCNEEYQELLEQKVKFGQLPKSVLDSVERGQDIAQVEANKFISTGDGEEATQNIGAFAIEQAFKELDERDQVFTNFCALSLSAFNGNGDFARQLDLLWANSFDKIRVCGLFDLALDAIQCLFKGLTLEEALSGMVQSALTAMSLENFGDMFVGLPPEKQQELDDLVKQKLQSGDIFPPDSQAQRVSDEAASGENARIDVDTDVKLLVAPEFVKPWENPELVNEQNQKMMVEGAYESTSPTGIPAASTRKSDVSDATIKAQLKNAGSELNPSTVMDAYIAALIEVYSEDLLDLVDILNRFPGAQIISKVIALIDCPVPPIFDPSMVDFLKDIELPFCRNTYHIGLPRLENPFSYLPKVKDIYRLLFNIIKIQLQKLVVSIIMKLVIKICELLGNAICKALETVGDLATAFPSVLAGKTTFKDVIRETICGVDTPDEQIDNTIVDMFQTLGSGGEAFADREAVMSFAEDLSASTTRKELSDAVLGNPSQTFLSVMEGLVNFEYPQFAEAFNNRENISSFFSNIGNLMPASARQAVKDFARGLDQDDALPANPSLCATPQQIEDFCSLRSGLLEGRASPEQIAAMCDNARNSLKNDLDDLSAILNDGIPAYLENNLPPLVSDPGCNNGLVPYEPEENIKSTTESLSSDMESLQISYTYDMIGNGPGERNWGFINMVLSDTMGNPYTTHARKSFNSGGFLTERKYVDFYVEEGGPDENYASLDKQQGAYPIYVADWLKDTQMPLQLGNASFVSNNSYQQDITFYKSFEELGFTGLFGDVDLLSLPDFGYNTEVSVDYEQENIKFIKKARKTTPDITLDFKDNAKGTGGFSYGFELQLFVSDVVEENGVYVNTPSDNARVLINNLVNTKAKVDASDGAYSNVQDSKSKNDSSAIMSWRAYEFLSSDNSLQDTDITAYPRFYQTTTSHKQFMPQIYMLQDIIEKAGGTPPEAQVVKEAHDQAIQTLFRAFAEQVYLNEDAFRYGAEYDDLDYGDVAYGVVNDAGEWQEYSEYASENGITNEDAVLGVSYDQYLNEQDETPENTRVYYLDPAQYGGTYFNPPVYIKPMQNKGWLGFVNVMFPELSPCKPYRADIIDFRSIQDRIASSYSQIPEDDRLRSDPDCTTEEPYNRILERPAKAGIEGLISAAIRIYASVHLLKASATFTKFKPDFNFVHSRIYPQYIIERMQDDFKEGELFKQEAFWYSFLEQCVQTYARRYADGQLEDPPANVVDALLQIEQVIEQYDPIYKDTYTSKNGSTVIGLNDAKKLGDASLLQTLKGYRADKNLEAVKQTEEFAKTVLLELVIEELQEMSEIYIENMQEVGMASQQLVTDIRKFALENLTEGSTLTIDKEIKEEVSGISTTETENIYTSGGTLITEDGEEYVGYYHVEEDEEGDTIYVSGAYPRDDGEILRVSAEKIIVPIGNVADIGDASPSSDKPFSLEKYIKIDGVYKKPSEAIATIKNSGTSDNNISDVYPGTMELVYNDKGQEIGIQGELGVRYGLRFSIDVGAGKQTLVEVEVDALDLPVTEVQPLEADSKLLLCLVNNLLDEPDFDIVMKYVFSLNKLVSTVAIYNDMGFVSSIGETVVEDGRGTEKPGRYIFVTYDGTDSEGAPITSVEIVDGEKGWFTNEDRSSGIFGNGFFVLHFDKWDQNLLRKSRYRIRKMFNGFYNSREFDVEDTSDETPGQAKISQLKEAFKPASGQRLLPWWKKRLLRTNPFNAQGELCSKKE